MTTDRIREIIDCERQADDHEARADELRWRAAELIAAELAAGSTTQQDLATAIGKSQAHVSYMNRTWADHQADQDRPSFAEAYRAVQRLADPARRARIEEQARADGLSPTTVDAAIRGPGVLRAAILADLQTAEVAYEALKQRARDVREAERAARAAEPEPESCGPGFTITIKESPVAYARRAVELIEALDRQEYDVPTPGGTPWISTLERRAIFRFRQAVEGFSAVMEREQQRRLAEQEQDDVAGGEGS